MTMKGGIMEYIPSFVDQLQNGSNPSWRDDLDTELYHHGIKGMKWGVRRPRNEDGIIQGAGAGLAKKMNRREAKTRYKNIRKNGMKSNTSDSAVTKRIKNDYNKLSDLDFRTKYSVGKKAYAKRVAKSATGDPFADQRSKMSKKSFDRAANAEAKQMTRIHLNDKAKEYGKNRSTASTIATSTLLSGKGGIAKRAYNGYKNNAAYNTARASGMSKAKSAASVALMGRNFTTDIANKKYRESRAGKAYLNKTRNSYYK